MAAATAPKDAAGLGARRRRAEAPPPPVAVRGLPEGATPLMYACQQGKDQEVRRILAEKPGCASDRDRTLKTALHYCAENSSAACASALLSVCPSLLDAVDEEGYTAVHLAVISGNRALLRLLIEKGANVTRMDREGHSAVHWATVCGEVEALEMVIAAGANPSTPDIHGAYPVHYAAQMCGANSATSSVDPRVGLVVLRRLLTHKVKVDVEDKDGRQPILWAASAGSADAIIALVHAGASVEAHDKDGLTALHCAASRGHTDCLETLVTLCGSEVDVIDANGCSALFYAATLGHADSTRLLLGFGAQPNRQDRKGRTAAHCGAAKGQLETLRLLSDVGGADLWIRNVKGDLPLHEAVQSGRRDLVRWLIHQRPAAVNAANNDGRSPLHVASIHNNVEMCKVLLDSHSLVNPVMRTPRGQMATPLDTALLRGNRGCAKFLQLHGGVPASKLTEESARLTGGMSVGEGVSPQELYLDSAGPLSAREPDSLGNVPPLPIGPPSRMSPPQEMATATPVDGFRGEANGGAASRATVYEDGHTTAPTTLRSTEDKFIQVNDDIAIQYVERIRLSENDGDQEEEVEELSVLRGKVSQRRLRGGEEESNLPRVRLRGETVVEGERRRTEKVRVGGRWSRGGEESCIREEEEEEESEEEHSMSRKKSRRKRTTRKTKTKRESEEEEVEEEIIESSEAEEEIVSEEEAEESSYAGKKRKGGRKTVKTKSAREGKKSRGGSEGSRRTPQSEKVTPVKKKISTSSTQQSTSPEKSEKDEEKRRPTKIPVRKKTLSRRSPEAREEAEETKSSAEETKVPVEEVKTVKKVAHHRSSERKPVKEACIDKKTVRLEKSAKSTVRRQSSIEAKTSATETDKEGGRDGSKERVRGSRTPIRSKKTRVKGDREKTPSKATPEIVMEAEEEGKKKRSSSTTETDKEGGRDGSKDRVRGSKTPMKSKKTRIKGERDKTPSKAKSQAAVEAPEKEKKEVSEGLEKKTSAEHEESSEDAAKSCKNESRETENSSAEGIVEEIVQKGVDLALKGGTVAGEMMASEDDSPLQGTVQGTVHEVVAIVHKEDIKEDITQSEGEGDGEEEEETEDKHQEVESEEKHEEENEEEEEEEEREEDGEQEEGEQEEEEGQEEENEDDEHHEIKVEVKEEEQKQTEEKVDGVIEKNVKESNVEEGEVDEGVVVEGPSEKDELTKEGAENETETKVVEEGKKTEETATTTVENNEIHVIDEGKGGDEEVGGSIQISEVSEKREEDDEKSAKDNFIVSEAEEEETARADEVEVKEVQEVPREQVVIEPDDLLKDRTEDDVSQLAEDISSINDVVESRDTPSKDEGISTLDINDLRTDSRAESEMVDTGSVADGGASTAEADVSIETIVAAGDRKENVEYDGTEFEEETHSEISMETRAKGDEMVEEAPKDEDRIASSMESSSRIPSLPLDVETPTSSSRAVEDSEIQRKGPKKGATRIKMEGRGREMEKDRIGVRVDMGKPLSEDEDRRGERRQGKTMPTTSVTQAVQNTLRKYQLERHIFSELLELKRLQIRAGRANENVLVKRLVDNFHGPTGSDITVGIKRYDGHYTFRSFEKYLYDQLRQLQTSDSQLVPKIQTTDDMEKISSTLRRTRATTAASSLPPDNPALCTHVTHRCHHAAHAYTGIPCAAYITKGGYHHHDHHLHPLNVHQSLPSQRPTTTRSTATGSFLPKIDSIQDQSSVGGSQRSQRYVDPSRPITLELSHNEKKQVVSLPTQRLDRPKRYLVTFTIKPSSGATEGVTITTKEGRVKVGPLKGDKISSPLSESPESDPTSFRHRHAKSL